MKKPKKSFESFNEVIDTLATIDNPVDRMFTLHTITANASIPMQGASTEEIFERAARHNREREVKMRRGMARRAISG
jgi:hypothetical protein